MANTPYEQMKHTGVDAPGAGTPAPSLASYDEVAKGGVSTTSNPPLSVSSTDPVPMAADKSYDELKN